MNSYSRLIAQSIENVAEKEHPYHLVTERHVQALWMEQKYIKGLALSTGETLEVLSPGIWNVEAGPDFRKAHIRIGKKEYFGDIEIHLNDESWYYHHHHNDERYNQVILHVSVWKPRQPLPILNIANRSILTLHLEPFLTIPLARIAQLIDLELYPYKKFIGSGKCAQELFNSLNNESIVNLFQKAAEWRLEQKLRYLQLRVLQTDRQLAAGIAMALGYKNNAESFLGLYQEMCDESFLNEENALAWLMRKCGFFNEYFSKLWGKSHYYQHLKVYADKLNIPSNVHLALNQIRPLNHPVRRLVYFVKMYFDPGLFSLKSSLKLTWDLSWRECHHKKKWKPFFEACLALIPSYQDNYWNSHYLFERESRTETLTLIGNDLKREIVINILLAILKNDLNAEDYIELEAFKSFYSSLTASKTGKSKYLTHRFFGDTSKGSILNKADMEQGAYQLHHDFCVHFEASCEGCPFVKRFKTIF